YDGRKHQDGLGVLGKLFRRRLMLVQRVERRGRVFTKSRCGCSKRTRRWSDEDRGERQNHRNRTEAGRIEHVVTPSVARTARKSRRHCLKAESRFQAVYRRTTRARENGATFLEFRQISRRFTHWCRERNADESSAA